MELSQQCVSSFIAEKTKQCRSLHEALVQTRAHVLQRVAQVPDAVMDLFPLPPLHETQGRLCRCRGMIQEVHSEVNLYCAYSGDFFHDKATAEAGAQEEFLDTTLLYVIPVPGNHHFYSVPGAVGLPPGTARGNDEETDAAHACTINSSTATHQLAGNRKRAQRDDSESLQNVTTAKAMDTPDVLPRRPAVARAEAETTAAAHTAAGTASSPTYSLSSYLNLPHRPVSRELSTACIVTVVLPRDTRMHAEGSVQRPPFRVNDVIDFYGFTQITTNDQLQPSEDDEFALFSTWHSAELSKGLVSRLLCLAHAPPCPLVTSPLPASTYFDPARQHAVYYLAQELCRGDTLVAEYVLLHMCSRVGVHSDTTPVGDAPLLVRSKELDPVAWSAVIARVAPVAEILLTSELLSGAGPAIQPRHDSEKNYLRTGLLQVGNGTHVTIDCDGLWKTAETATWGEALFTAVHKQTLLLEYPFQTLELPIDVSFLALATSDDAVIPTLNFALQVEWTPITGVCDDAHDVGNGSHQLQGLRDADEPAVPTPSHVTEAVAASVRQYISAVRSVTPSFTAEDDLHQHISDALCGLSEELRAWNNRDPLIHNNTFSAVTALVRTQAASRGRSAVTLEDLYYVLSLERRRIQRHQHH